MNDPHPKIIEIEIDRSSLQKYLRLTWLRAWILTMGFFGAMLGLAFASGRLENKEAGGLWDLVFQIISGVLYGILISTIIATVLYLILSHFRAQRVSESQSIRVDGAFLQIVQHVGYSNVDRKIHFRAITDFCVIEDKRMKRYGIKALQMNTTGGSPSGLIRIDGVKECDRVRDLLAEIDSIRENQTV